MHSFPGLSGLERRLLRKIWDSIGGPPVRLIVADGTEIAPGGPAVGKVILRNRRALFRLIADPQTGFGDGYSDGSIEVEGNLAEFLEAVYRAWPSTQDTGWLTRFLAHARERLHVNSLRASRHNVHHHYDLNTDFYQQWLDRQLVYTCAYFPAPSATLEEAQIAKMDHVCRKVQLEPGETVVEAGCGWGALALYMAKHYGVAVKAFNLSHEQIVFARQWAKREGLSGAVEFIEDDYRNVSGHFDAFVSVGMLEHVGLSRYAELGKVIHRAIGASGRGLLHFIARNQAAPLSSWIRKRIFPGAYAPTLAEAMTVLEPWDYAVCDVENLRRHYARTLEVWLERYERSVDRLSASFDEKFLRAWRLYLAGSMVAFRTGAMQLLQIVFAGPDCRRIPWTRAHLYTALPRQEPKWIHSMS